MAYTTSVSSSRSVDELPIKTLIIIGAIALLALITAIGSFYSVDSGEVGVVTRFGAVSRVSPPGLHMKMPFFEGVKEIGTRTHTIEWGVDGQEDRRMLSYSKDQQPAHISVKVVFSVKQDEKSVLHLFNQYRDLDRFSNSIIVPRTYESVKSVFGTFDAVTVIQNREMFNAKIRESLATL